MNPTCQRRQLPLKAALDYVVFGWTTYVLPALAAAAVGAILFCSGTSRFWPTVIVSLHFWVVAYVAVTTYRRTLLVPRAMDLMLDPPNDEYLAFAARQTLFAFVPPLGLCLVFGVLDSLALPLAAAMAAIYWAVGLAFNVAYFQRHGQPYISDGAAGQRLKPAAALRSVVIRNSPDREHTIPWGGVPLGLDALLKNFLLLGSVGSGKTLVMRQWLASVLPLVNRYRNWRALIIDPKCEYYAFLASLVLTYKLIMITPGDARSFAWMLAEDLTTEQKIHEAARLMIPQKKNQSQPFFDNAACQSWMAVMLAFNLQAPGKWWFSDVYFATRSAARMKTILGLHRASREILEAYASNQRVFFDIFATLDANTADFLPIAAAWSHSQRDAPHRTTSLTRWVNGNHVLLLGQQASADTAQSRINAVILKRASQLLLDKPTGQSTKDPATASRTIIAIDEAARAGKLDILNALITGRDYGMSCFVATQSVEALVDIYGEKIWDAMASEFHSVGFLNTNSPSTARWMSERLGKLLGFRAWDKQPGRTAQPANWSPTLEPTHFMTLSQGNHVHPGCVPGVFANSQWGAWVSEEGVEFPADCAGVPQLMPAKPCSLRPWDDEDLRRLNLTHVRHLLDLDDPPTSAAAFGPGPRPNPPTNYPRFRP